MTTQDEARLKEAMGLAPGRPLGMVVGGSLTGGVHVRLDASASVEDVKVGTYVTLQGQRQRFFGMVTDVALGASDPRLSTSPPDVSDPFIAQVMAGTAAFGTLTVMPQLVLPAVAGDSTGTIAPAKTIPAHFARAFAASEADIAQVFGQEDRRHFWVGSPLDMETKVCLDLEELVKRSNGIFGKSGTGKSFLTRLLLAGVVQKSGAVALVFDMHNEYGWAGRDPERGRQVKGLAQLFPGRVGVFALDEQSSLRRGIHPDVVVRIGYQEIEPEDIALLAQTLNLTPLAAEACHKLPRHLGRSWLHEFLRLESEEELAALAERIGEHAQTVRALRRRLERLRRLPFLVPETHEDAVRRLLEFLDNGKHVVLEFGAYGRSLEAYILVANVLSRRIHERYVHRVEQASGEGAVGPRPLVIVIEEAHRFLHPEVASQTIFGTIAREMRKYNVTLLVVDQRPSAIDSEVMSQIGTKICCLLDDEHDVEAVLSGVSGSRELRSVLARLESKQQALIFGHAVPVPVVVHVRDYGTERSYAELLGSRGQGTGDRGAKDEDELFG